jgi:hypothetical protein
MTDSNSKPLSSNALEFARAIDRMTPKQRAFFERFVKLMVHMTKAKHDSFLAAMNRDSDKLSALFQVQDISALDRWVRLNSLVVVVNNTAAGMEEANHG